MARGGLQLLQTSYSLWQSWACPKDPTLVLYIASSTAMAENGYGSTPTEQTAGGYHDIKRLSLVTTSLSKLASAKLLVATSYARKDGRIDVTGMSDTVVESGTPGN